MKEPKRALTIAFPQELYDQLAKLAEEEGRSKGMQITFLLKKALLQESTGRITLNGNELKHTTL